VAFPLGGKSIGKKQIAAGSSIERRREMRTILLVILVLVLVGALPTWPYSGGWGYYPSGGLGLVLVIALILVVLGRI
jgi:hypothetical protein